MKSRTLLWRKSDKLGFDNLIPVHIYLRGEKIEIEYEEIRLIFMNSIFFPQLTPKLGT